MPTPSLESAASWTGAGAVFTTLLGLIIRFLMKTFRTDRLEATSTAAEISTYKKLQDEITRLEGIIIAQQTRTDELEIRLDTLRDIELEGQADLAVLSVLIHQLPCGRTCTTPSDAFDQLREVLDRMNARKVERQSVIREATHKDQQRPRVVPIAKPAVKPVVKPKAKKVVTD